MRNLTAYDLKARWDKKVMKASKLAPRSGLSGLSNKWETEMQKCVVGSKRRVPLWESRKLPETEPKACASTWGLSLESARKVLDETQDSIFK